MRALLTAVIAATEAAAIALAGLMLVGIPAALIWWTEFNLEPEPSLMISVVAAMWFLAHFIGFEVSVSAESALSLGLPAEEFDFLISIAPLGVTALTLLLALRAGWRFSARGTLGIAGVVGGTIGFGTCAFLLADFSEAPVVLPLWGVIGTTMLCFAIPAALAFITRGVRDRAGWWVRASRTIERKLGVFGGELRVITRWIIRVTSAALAGLVALGGAAVMFAIIFGYVDIVTLNQALQLDVLGTVLMFVLNLVLLPTGIIWAIAWLSGAGFSLGASTSVSPFETLLGPVPALPLFGAIPQGWGFAAVLAPMTIVLLGVCIGALAGGVPALREAHWRRPIVVVLIAALLTALIIALLNWAARGAVGPGRLEEVGPEVWPGAIRVTIELAAGLVLGVISRRIDTSRLQAKLERRDTIDSPESMVPLPATSLPAAPSATPQPTAPQPAGSQSAAPQLPASAPTPHDEQRKEPVIEVTKQLGIDASADEIAEAYSWQTPTNTNSGSSYGADHRGTIHPDAPNSGTGKKRRDWVFWRRRR